MAARNSESVSSNNGEFDWQVNKSLAECNRYMLEHEISCDISFQVGSNGAEQIVCAHKYILASRSPVFFAMLLGDLANHNRDVISIPDVNVEAFRMMLRFLYCEDCQLTSDVVLPTLYASKKYIIPMLTQKCTLFLEENLNADNVCLIHEQCILFDEGALLEKCKFFIETRTDEVINSPTFLDLADSTLESILKFDRLSVSEVALYHACLKWSEKECQRRCLPDTLENRRLALGRIIYLLHFPTMSLKEFANEVSCTGVLSPEDRCTIFEYLACDEDRRTNMTSLKFPSGRRQKPEPLSLKRFTMFGKSNIYSGDCSMMRLQSDLPVVIKGFGVSGSMGFDPLAELQVTIKQDRNFLCNRSIPVTDDLNGEVIEVLLNEAISLQPNVWYTVIITFHFYGDHDQGTCRRGKGGTKVISMEGITFEFDRSDSGSLIPEVIFCRGY